MTDTTNVVSWKAPHNPDFITTSTPPAPGSYESAREDYIGRFRRLLTQWRSETVFMSSVDGKINHPAFRQIVELGKLAVPLILKEITIKPDHLYLALQLMTGENPVPVSQRGDLRRAVDAWIDWSS